MALPASVIKKDHDLEQDYDTIGSQLMELRWHWTLNESNPKRVTISEYARSVGRTQKTISIDAKTWVQMIADDEGSSLTDSAGSVTPKKKPNEYREMAYLSADRQHAAEAIAKVTGNALSTVTRTKREEITAVVGRAQERAEKKGTRVDDEIDRAVEWDAKARRTAEKQRAEKKARHTSRFIEIEGDLGVAMQRLRKVLTVAEDVGFTPDEIELMTVSLGKLRALMNLIDLRIAGETDIDWDKEFQKIDN
jgi:gas vesicle protein